MKRAQNNEYFTERSRAIRNCKPKLSILQQFERYSPAPNLKRAEDKPAQGQTNQPGKLRQDTDSSARSRDTNQECAVKMSESIQYNKNRVFNERLRQRVNLQATRSSQRGVFAGRYSKLLSSKASRPQITPPSSLQGPSQRFDKQATSLQQGDSLRRLLGKYVSRIDSFRILGQETPTPAGPNNLDRLWFYSQYSKHRGELLRLLLKLKETMKPTLNNSNFRVLEEFTSHLQQQNTKIEEAMALINSKIKCSSSVSAHLSRRELCSVLRDELQSFESQEDKTKPEILARARLLHKGLSAVELLRKQRFLKEFEQLLF